MKTIIGLTGKAGAGKDTLALCLKEQYGYERIAFADEVKVALLRLNPVIYFNENPTDLYTLRDAEALYKWDFLKRNTNLRGLLQRMGTEVGREMFDEDVWLNKALNKIIGSESTHFVITDVRFDNEAKFIERTGGTIFKIEKYESDHTEERLSSHISEQGISTRYIYKTLFNDNFKDFPQIAEQAHQIAAGRNAFKEINTPPQATEA